jgi:hypothetical protein
MSSTDKTRLEFRRSRPCELRLRIVSSLCAVYFW